MTYGQNIQTSVPDGLAVADVFDAMTTDGPNQKVMRTQEALNELRENEGLRLDR
jgi:HD-GYP domain-containing protein (c-di-GMP phosphodiesterase class II)